MSVPFSNTSLRIPRGFGNLLEGLSREVLREQPLDIIEFAAAYFEDLLKKRTASGIDPADWAAQLEDRFYNNHIFKEKQTTIPEIEPKSAPVTIDTAYEEKDESILDEAEALEGMKKICIKKPTHFTSISQQTVSMMLQDKEKHSKQSIVSRMDGATTAAVKEPKEGPLEEKAHVLTGEAPEQGPLDDTDSKMIAAAPVEVPMDGTTSQITAAGLEEGLLEGTTSQVIADAPEASPLEVTDSQVILATSEQGQDTASEMITAAPEQDSLEETASQVIASPLEEESREDTTAQMITTASAEDESRKIESSEKPYVDTSGNEEQAAAIIQSAYRGYNARKKLKEDTPSAPEADDDLFTEARPGTDGIDYSSGEELTFTEDENTNFEETLGMNHEETKSRMEANGLHSSAKDGTAEINICAAELGSPMEKATINTIADICAAELQPAIKEDNKSEPDMATEMAGHDICGTELDQKDFLEAASVSTANVDICGTELGVIVGKDTSQEDNDRNEIDIKPQDEPADNITEEAAHQHNVSGVLNDSEDQANVDQKHTEDIKEGDLKVNDIPSTGESAEGGNSMVE